MTTVQPVDMSLGELSTLLRVTGMQAVTAVLTNAPAPALGARWDTVADLLSPFREPLWFERRRHARLRRALARAAVPKLPPTAAALANAVVPPPRWERLVRRASVLLGLTSARHAPRAVWALAATTAWDDLQFQHDVGVELRRFWRRRVPLGREASEWPRLHPRAVWGAIAVAYGTRPRRRWEWLPGRRRESGRVERLVRLAVTEACVPGWAGWLDQWLLLEAVRRFDGTWARIPRPLGAALSALPFARPDAGRTRVALEREGWNDTMPAWLAKHAGGFEAMHVRR